MNEAQLTETLDERGLLDLAHNPGSYALELAVPDTAPAARTQWYGEHDVAPDNDALERLAHAEDVAYVGASGDVYGRLTDHANGEVRQAAVLEAFGLADVVNVWPDDNPFESEWRTAKLLAADGWTVWSDGVIHG